MNKRDQLFELVIQTLEEYELQSVADFSGVHISTLYNWVNRKIVNPHSATLFNVAEVIGIDIEWVNTNKQLRAA